MPKERPESSARYPRAAGFVIPRRSFSAASESDLLSLRESIRHAQTFDLSVLLKTAHVIVGRVVCFFVSTMMVEKQEK